MFFLVDPSHPGYELLKNVVAGQMFVAAFGGLHDYPVGDTEILHVGKPAFDAALGTVNVGKVNLGWASIGICEHSFYEAVTRATGSSTATGSPTSHTCGACWPTPTPG